MIRWPTWLSWPQWVGEERRAQQRQVMAVGTVLISINAVVFNLLPNPGYDAHLLFVVAALFVVVLGLAKYERLYYAVVNFCCWPCWATLRCKPAASNRATWCGFAY